MDRPFLDANVLFSAAYRADSGLRRLWSLSNIQLCSSAYAAEEARRNLDSPLRREELERLLAKVELSWTVAPERPLPSATALPEKDRPILLAAIAMQASHLLTGDFRHFGPLFGTTIEGVIVLPPAEYLRPPAVRRTLQE